MVPEFPWESVAVPVAKWMGVSSDQLATTFPYFNSFECTVLVPVVALCWCGELRLVCGAALMTLDCLSGSLQVSGPMQFLIGSHFVGLVPLGSLWQVDCPPRYVRGIGARQALCNSSSSSLF